MRSRFAAFATKQVDYVFRTLHADHEDRARPREGVMRAIRDACAENRYLGLRILDARGPNADGVAQVLFAARVFHRGKERSFVECSDFVHDGVGWRYRSGEGIARAWDEVRPTTIAEFLARRPDVTA
jgi:SEC-C motif-containing protein